MKQIKTGNNINPSLDNAKRVVAFAIRIQVLVFHKKNRISFLKPSSKQKVLPAVNMEELVWDFPSAVVLQNCWVERLNWKVRSGQEVHFTLFLPIDYNPAMVKKEKQSSLKVSEYKLAEGSTDDMLFNQFLPLK